MRSFLIVALAAALLPLTAPAATRQVPAEGPGFSVTIPDSWKSEDTDKGFGATSPDQAATIYFETVKPKGVDKLIDENIDWLLKDQKVELDSKSEKQNAFEAAGMKWNSISWDGKDDTYGPATIILATATAPDSSRVLMVTYWVTKDGEATYKKKLDKIWDSVKWTGEAADSDASSSADTTSTDAAEPPAADAAASKPSAPATVTYPAKNPVFSVDVPDGWTTKDHDGALLILASPTTGAVLQHVSGIDKTTAADDILAGYASIAKISEQGSNLTEESVATPPAKMTIGGCPGFVAEYKGKNSDGNPAFWQVIVFAPEPGNYFMVTMVGTDKEDAATADARTALVDSIKPLKAQ